MSDSERDPSGRSGGQASGRARGQGGDGEDFPEVFGGLRAGEVLPRDRMSVESPEVRDARRILARMATQDGPYGADASVALAVVDSVTPPYPPIEELPEGTAVPLRVAIEALRSALRAASTLEEAVRLGEAGLELSVPEGA